MIELKSLKNKHPNRDIYILGSGPSLSFIDSSFLHGKIVICINHTIELPIVTKKTPHLYLVAKEPTKKMHDAAKNKNALIVMCHTHSGNKGAPKNEMYYPDITVLFSAIGGCITNKTQTTKLERSTSTIISGMHLAVFMGCKNILLIGHDCGSLNGERHVDGYSKEGAVNPTGKYHAWISGHNIEGKTIKFKKAIKNLYGVNTYSINPFINFGLEGNSFNHWKKKN